MQEVNFGTVAGKVYDLLKGLDSNGRKRVLVAAQALFGEQHVDAAQKETVSEPVTGAQTGINQPVSASAFFDEKNPRGKGAELAVAARFIEKTENKEIYTREDLEKVFKLARRNFDSKMFVFDIRNARNANYFNKGGSPGEYRLSYTGQNFVDALPDLKQAKKARRKVSAAAKKGKGR